MAVRILLADDHELLRAGLRAILERQPDFRIIAEAADASAAVQLARELSPDVVIIDLALPEMNGLDAIRRIAGFRGAPRIIVMSGNHDRTFAGESIEAGAAGYLLKSSACDDLILAVREAFGGRTYCAPDRRPLSLCEQAPSAGSSTAGRDAVDARRTREPAPRSGLTAKQREVLQLLAEGKSNKEAAAVLSVSPKTIEAHRAQIMQKLKIHTVAGLTKYAIRKGLTSIDS
jgi:DNA-binding NarL/FixJ family response regulator